MLAVVVAAQAVLYIEDGRAADTLASAVVTRAEAVSRARRNASDAARRLKFPHCSTTDILALKKITFRSSYMSDVGRIQDGHLVCSALWGGMTPFKLPPPRYASGDTQLWSARDLAGSPYEGTNLIAQGESYTVSSPSSFDGLDPSRTSAITIETRDRSYVFRHLLPNAEAGRHSSSRVRLSHCSKSANICAFISQPRRTVWNLSPALLATIMGAAAAFGAVLSYAIIRRRRGARQTLQERFISAMRRGEIGLVYQPLRTLADGGLIGFEVLSRWTPPDEGEISPGIFVPMARELGLSSELFRYVLSNALKEMAPTLRTQTIRYISINAEPADMATEDIVEFVESTARQNDVPPARIRFEITEREDLACRGLTANMAALAARGFRFLMDDFGTGSSNFSHFAQSPFVGIKIDRMFVSAVTEESPLRPVLPGMYQIARQLGLDVIVEGVETECQDALLRQLAPFAIGQGWFYGMPVACEAAAELVSSHSMQCGDASSA